MAKKKKRTPSTRRKPTVRSSARIAKKSTPRTVRKSTSRPKKRSSNAVASRASKSKSTRVQHVDSWEIVPFAIAVIVAVVVVLQSVNSAKELRQHGGTMSIRPALIHMAGGCEVESATLRKLRAAERAVERAAYLKDRELFREKVAELQRLRIEACL